MNCFIYYLKFVRYSCIKTKVVTLVGFTGTFPFRRSPRFTPDVKQKRMRSRDGIKIIKSDNFVATFQYFSIKAILIDTHGV